MLRKPDNSVLTAQKKPVINPYADSTAVSSAAARLANVAGQTAPAAPTNSLGIGGNPIEFGYNNTTTAAQALTIGCVATRSGSTWTLTCPPGATRTISAVTISGGIQVVFNPTGTAQSVLNIANTLTGQDRMTFGPGTYNIRGNFIGGSGGITFNGNALNVGGFIHPGTSGTSTFGAGTYSANLGIFLMGSSTVSFGAGTFNIGRATVACGSSGFYSICSQTSGGVTIAGPSTFNLHSGMRVGGGATIALGNGSNGNSFHLGSSSDGFAFRGDGGAKTTIGNATAGGLMRFGGNVNLTGGGSCLVIGEAPQHDIRGNLWATGAMLLRPGVYTVLGTVNFGGSGGGNAMCGGSSIGLYADGVTLVIGADNSVSQTGNGCAGTPAFCLSAGYSSVLLRPQASGALADFAVIGPQSASNARGALLTSGATNSVINGVFYMPNGPFVSSGGAATGDAGGCLELVARNVSLSAGAVLGSNCASSGSTARNIVRLVP